MYILFGSKELFALKGSIHEPAAVYNSHTEHHNPLNSSVTVPSREQALFIKLFLILWSRDLCYYVTLSGSKPKVFEYELYCLTPLFMH